jgi:hypothetical protein
MKTKASLELNFSRNISFERDSTFCIISKSLSTRAPKTCKRSSTVGSRDHVWKRLLGSVPFEQPGSEWVGHGGTVIRYSTRYRYTLRVPPLPLRALREKSLVI